MPIHKADRKKLPTMAVESTGFSILQYLIMLFQSFLRLFYDLFFGYVG